MSPKIDQGLFNLDFTDYHAILGVPVDADIKDIRKSYLKIARRLHPDSCTTENESDRQRAAELLSKLVNPAYEKLSNDRNYTEYQLLLRLKGQQALKQQETVLLVSDSARRLAAASDIDYSYKVTLKDLADKQYEQLDRSLELTGQLSELNLVYLMRTEGRGSPVNKSAGATTATATATPTHNPAQQAAASRKQPPTRRDLLDAYVRRAQEFETKQDYTRAILELRDALQIEPKNSDCHSRLGVIYLKTNQATMAKIHFNKALELNPQDPTALEGKRRIEGAGENKAAGTQKAPQKGGKSDQSGGGLFGLFGGKKK